MCQTILDLGLALLSELPKSSEDRGMCWVQTAYETLDDSLTMLGRPSKSERAFDRLGHSHDNGAAKLTC
jgi:hypothetical protein